jgi:hypothetical protein
MRTIDVEFDARSSRDLELEGKLERMTLIVGLVGIDGIVLAADRERRAPAQAENEVDDVSSAFKIFHLARHGVTYAVAGDQDAILSVGRDLERSLDDGLFDFGAIESSLAEFSSTTWREHGHKAVSGQCMLIAFAKAQQLWHLEFPKFAHIQIERIPSKQICGAKGNSARFVLDAYFNQDMPVAKLKLLAAHVVLSGYKVDRFINGLDVAIIEKDNYYEMTPEERNSIREKSRAIDRLIFEA